MHDVNVIIIVDIENIILRARVVMYNVFNEGHGIDIRNLWHVHSEILDSIISLLSLDA